jgi:LPS export ABC transporter protein LptC
VRLAYERAAPRIAYNRSLPAHGRHRTFVRNTVVMLVLAILAAATWVATWPRQAPDAPAGTGADTRPLGYYVRGARLLGTDEEGRVLYRINAENFDELPDEQRLQLTGVDIEYLPADGTAWTLSATSASAPKDASLLDLVGTVEVSSTPTDGSKPLTILTEKLRFSPDTSSAESDEAVQIRVGDWRLDGVGLRMHLKGDSLELESQVHGTFSR